MIRLKVAKTNLQNSPSNIISANNWNSKNIGWKAGLVTYLPMVEYMIYKQRNQSWLKWQHNSKNLIFFVWLQLCFYLAPGHWFMWPFTELADFENRFQNGSIGTKIPKQRKSFERVTINVLIAIVTDITKNQTRSLLVPTKNSGKSCNSSTRWTITFVHISSFVFLAVTSSFVRWLNILLNALVHSFLWT